MTASSYETRRYAGHWKIPWGTVKSFEFERSRRQEPTATQCSIDVDMLGFWRRIVDRRRGLFFDVDLASDDQQIRLTFLGQGRAELAVVFGVWSLDTIHGLSLQFGAVSSRNDTNPDEHEGEFKALLRQAELEYPHVLVRGETLYWIPAICLGELRELWLEVGKPQCGELVLRRCEQRTNEVLRLHYSSAYSTNQQTDAATSDVRASEEERFSREFERLSVHPLRTDADADTDSASPPIAEIVTERVEPDDDGSSSDTVSPPVVLSPAKRVERDDEGQSSDILLLRLQKLRDSIRGDSVMSWVNDEIGDLILQYPDRPEVYLLGFEIFSRSHDVTRAWNTLDSLERLDGHAESINYELAKARKKLANLVDRVGRGPSDSIVAWIKYALLRPLDGSAFQRVLRFSQDIGIHEDFEKLVRLRIASILERDEPSIVASPSSTFQVNLRYPAEAIYPAITLIALTTRSNPDERARLIGSFRESNEFPQEWWEDAVLFADHVGPLPSVEKEAEIWAGAVREVAIELAADPAVNAQEVPSTEGLANDEQRISYEQRSAEILSRRNREPADSEKFKTDGPSSSDLPRLHIGDPGSDAGKSAGDRAAPPALEGIDRTAASGQLKSAIGEIVEMLGVTTDQEIRSELLLRKARWLRELNEDARKVSFALTGVRILKPHSLDVHMEFIRLHLRENHGSKAREAAIALLDSLVEAHEPLDYEARDIIFCLKAAGIESSRVLPSRLQTDLEKSHPILLDLLGHD